MQNPEAANPPNAGLGKNQKADYPEDKKKEFEGTPGGYSWISAKDTSLLDFNGCELVLIASKADISGAPQTFTLQGDNCRRSITFLTKGRLLFLNGSTCTSCTSALHASAEVCKLTCVSTDTAGELDGKVSKALDEAVEHEVEEAEHFKGNDEDAKLLEKLRSELHAEKHDVPVQPAADGKWK